MKKLLTLLALLISFGVSAQINAVNDTVRITPTAPTFTPNFIQNIFNSGGVNYRMNYLRNPSTNTYDAVVYSKYLRSFYFAKKDTNTRANPITFDYFNTHLPSGTSFIKNSDLSVVQPSANSWIDGYSVASGFIAGDPYSTNQAIVFPSGIGLANNGYTIGFSDNLFYISRLSDHSFKFKLFHDTTDNVTKITGSRIQSTARMGLDSLPVVGTDIVNKNALDAAISGGSTPTGSAGGDLSGTYPNPTINTINGITSAYYDPISSIQTQLNDKAKKDSSLQVNKNLYDLADKAVSRTNLGVYSTTQSDANYIQNQTASQQTAGFLINGIGTFGDGTSTIRSTNYKVGIVKPVNPTDGLNDHGFITNIGFIKTTNGLALADYDGFDLVGDNTAATNYDHHVTYQARTKVDIGTGTLTNLYGSFTTPSIISGTVTNAYGSYIKGPSVSGTGALVNSTGLFIQGLTTGSGKVRAILTGNNTSTLGDVESSNTLATGSMFRFVAGSTYVSEGGFLMDGVANTVSNIHMKVRTISAVTNPDDTGTSEVFGIYGGSTNYALFSSGMRSTNTGIPRYAGSGTNATFISGASSQFIMGDGSLVSTASAAIGGTGQSTYTNGQLLIGNTTGNTLTKATLSAGNGIVVTNGTGSITLAGDTSILASKTFSGRYAQTNTAASFSSITSTATGGTAFQSNTSTANANFITSGTNMLAFTTSRYLFGGATTILSRAAIGAGSSTTALGTGYNYAGVIVPGSPILAATSGTNPWAANLVVVPNSYTTGTGTVTNSATVYIDGAASFATNNYAFAINSGNTLLNNGNLTLGTAGNKINIATGTNASVGTATLVAGTVTVSTTAVTASSKIFLTDATTGALTNIGTPTVGTIVAGTSFVINSSNILDTSAVNWFIIN